MKLFSRLKILHSLGFVLYPLLFLYERNQYEVRSSDLFEALGALSLGWLVTLLVASFLIGNLQSASILIAIVSLLALFYGPLVKALAGDVSSDGYGLSDLSFRGIEWLIAPLCFVAILYLYRLLTVNSARREGASSFLSLFAVMLLSMPLLTLGVHSLRGEPTLKIPTLIPAELPEIANKPDIYYLIVDGYGRSDVLKDLYDYDNSALIDGMKGLGFYVAEQARANYPLTVLSLASALNSCFLHECFSIKPSAQDRNSSVIRALKRPRILRLFKALGYSIVSLQSGYFPAELEISNKAIDTQHLNAALAPVLSLWQLPLIRNFISQNLHFAHQEMVLDSFQKVSQLSDLPGPKFVFIHLLVPHPPFVLSGISPGMLGQKSYSLGDGDHYGDHAQYHADYREQITKVSEFLVEAIPALIKATSGKAVVIVQGDHGPGSELKFAARSKSNHTERFGILNAYYFPNRDYSKLYPSISPINSFGAILATLFNIELAQHEDRSYFPPISDSFEQTVVSVEGSTIDDRP